ncbi:hypothetical protein J6590_065932 [Homalodisca vitripennis]|nr:hypothetical protein J6590_065932 [Homalodisca vitripennis]
MPVTRSGIFLPRYQMLTQKGCKLATFSHSTQTGLHLIDAIPRVSPHTSPSPPLDTIPGYPAARLHSSNNACMQYSKWRHQCLIGAKTLKKGDYVYDGLLNNTTIENCN